VTSEIDGAVAEFNMGRLRYDWTDKRVQGFVEGLERVNRLAERSPGYIWRMPDTEMEAAQLGPPLSDDRVASTLSTWRSVDQLLTFVRDSLHGSFMRRGPEWFEAEDGPRYVIWPITRDHRPTVEEGFSKLNHLAKYGPSKDCFNFRWYETMRDSE